MNFQKASLPGQTESAANSKVFLLYTDREAGTRAKRFADSLAQMLELETTLSAWRCEMLDFDSLAGAAAEEADGCDFLILSLAGNVSLPQATKSWIEKWAERAAAREALLITLFDPARSLSRHVESTREYLRSVCHNARVDFFAHCPLSPAASTEPQPAPDRASYPTFPISSLLTAFAA